MRERIRHSGRPCVPSGHANHHNSITAAPLRSTTQYPPNKQPGTCRAETSGTSHEKAALRSRLQRQRAATVTAYRLKSWKSCSCLLLAKVPPAASKASGAVSQWCREGVKSHSLVHRSSSEKKSAIPIRARRTRCAAPSDEPMPASRRSERSK